MAIQGKKKENNFETKELKVGFVEGKILTINPSIEEYQEKLGIELKEDSKATEYLGESKEGNPTVRLDIWFEDVKTGEKNKVVYFLEDKDRTNKDGSKTQFLNTVGRTTWADKEENLASWFTKSDFRIAKQGESDLYEFAKYWLAGLDTSDGGELSFSWKNLIKGNVKELKEQIGGGFDKTVLFLLEVKNVEKDGETKAYQSVYNKSFLYPSDLKFFKLVDYNKEEVLENLKKIDPKKLKRHEKFALDVTGEHGSKNSFLLKEAITYNPDDFLVASNEVLDEASPEY